MVHLAGRLVKVVVHLALMAVVVEMAETALLEAEAVGQQVLMEIILAVTVAVVTLAVAVVV
jgi:hypothetical protein